MDYSYREEHFIEEMLDGKVIYTPKPNTKHGEVGGNIICLFANYLRGKKYRAFYWIEVYLDDYNTVVPDLCVICNPDIIKEQGIYGTPDLIIEIICPSTSKTDKTYKKNLYEKFGVKEYWIISPRDCYAEVYHLIDEAYQLTEVYHRFEDYKTCFITQEEINQIPRKIKVSIFDDLYIDVDDIFHNV